MSFSLRSLLAAVLAASVTFAILAAGIKSQIRRRNGDLTGAAQSHLSTVVAGLFAYHDAYGTWPPAYITNELGEPIHSWRVLLLPFIHYGDLYEEYDFSEPWNGPNNMKLVNRGPHYYGLRTLSHQRQASTYSAIAAVQGAGTSFPGSQATSKSVSRNGDSRTLLLVEVKDNDILWLEPRDVDVAFVDSARMIAGPSWRPPFVVLSDGQVQPVLTPITQAEFRAAATRPSSANMDAER